MITYEVKDMSCGHCVNSITRAVHAVDPGAQITADVATYRVRIEPTQANATELADAIREAGYTPVPVDDPAMQAEKPASSIGCCCR